MKKSTLIFTLALFLMAMLNVELVAQADKAQYIGATKCKMCHSSKARGDAYGIWMNSKHAQAFTMLGSEEAKAAAKKAGLDGDPQKSGKCLKCHVTAFDAPATAKAATYKQEEGVTCETCHGPGSLYQPMKVMKALADGSQDAKAVAFREGEKDKCVKCHNSESPTFKEFKVEEALKLIAHPTPKTTK